MNVQETLQARQGTHGSFRDNAGVSRTLKHVMRQLPGWPGLTDVQQEALEVIQTKIARILTGDPNLIDHWRDVIGYASLVVEDLAEVDGATDVLVTKVTRQDGKWVKL